MISQAIKNVRRVALRAMPLLLLLSAASCVSGPSGVEPCEPGIPEGMVKVGLYTGAGDYQTPVSRAAADEGYNSASMPWVFVFSGADGNAAFAEVKQAGGGTSPYVVLTKQSSPVRLLIVANAPATLFNGTTEVAFTENNLVAALAGATFATAVNDILNTAKINNPSVVPYTGSYLPMSGALDISEGINENTSIGTAGSKVELRRVVAKVTVENSASGFTLSAVSAAGAKQYGRFYQIPSGPTVAGNTINYGADIAAASLENTLADPVYIYESPAGETSVIVKGVYNGGTYYYKLAFKDPADGSVMAVSRNMWYRFGINSVVTAGYSTFGEAAAGNPSNIDYTVTVIDQSAYDMTDNGQFYIGLSNSEYLIYGYFAAAEQLTAATVTTNATTAMASAINSVTVSGTGLGLVSGSAALNLSTDGATPASTDLKITVASNFTAGTVTVKLGNLIKVITVAKVSSNLVAFGMATQMDYHSGNQYTSATIGNAASSWLSLSTDGIASAGHEFTQPDAAGFLPLYLISQDNPQGSPARQADDIYLTRRDAGRVKVFVKQAALEYSQISPAYVGTFHRWNETGERVIRITYSSTNAGEWTALILSGGDFIKMDTGSSTRTYPLGGDAESNQVGGNNKVVRGKSSSSTAPVYFRVGMTGTHPSGSAAGTGGTAVPRYGLIALAYAENTKIHLIYVRQGEAAGVINSSVKWSPYNLSDPLRGLGGPNLADHSLFTPRAVVGANTFSDYPTHVGYLFRWNLYNPSDANSNRAFHVTNPSGAITGYPSSNISTWNAANDPCPKGYRHPTGAELVDFAAADLSNSYWGYCADGFFDRLSGGSSYSVTGSENYMYGICGRLFFNASTKASVFFPAAGNRIGSSGDRGFTGTGCYSSSNLLSGNVHNLYFTANSVEPSDRQFATMRALSVRCVEDYVLVISNAK